MFLVWKWLLCLTYKFSSSFKETTLYFLWAIMQICRNVWFGSRFGRPSTRGGTHFLYPGAIKLYGRILLCWCPSQIYVSAKPGDRLMASSPHKSLLFVTQTAHLNLTGITIQFLRKFICWHHKREASRSLELSLEIRIFFFRYVWRIRC